MNTFSIVLPAFNREKTVSRAINSVINQTHKNWELILVDDGSTDSTLQIMQSFQINYNKNIKIVRHKNRQERIASRNDGMRAAKNDWICWLDSDDEYMTNYLEVLDRAINKHPEYRIFNFGSVIHHDDKNEFRTTVRLVFIPDEKGQGHVNFTSGKMGTGVFIFHKSLLEEIEFLKPCYRPYGDPAEVVGDMGPMGQVNPNPNYPQREDKQFVPYGNPWGDDYEMIYRLTRMNKMKSLEMLLYVEHRRP